MRAYSPAHITVPLPDGHRFPMHKYALLRDALRERGWQVRDAPDAPWEAIARVHTPDYVRAWQEGTLEPRAVRKLGLPQSPELLQRSLASVGGTLAALSEALEHRWGANLAGGTHHAYAGHGEGFCVFNDHAVAARHALAHGLAERILIIDLDVHQGNGSAHIFAKDPHVFTFSAHGARNYPFHKEESDRDVGLEDGTDDAGYLRMLHGELPVLFDRFSPDLLFYQAGVDVLAGDRFGRMSLSLAGVEKRDRYVYGLCLEHSIPLVYTMGGGYHPDIGQTVQAHVNGLLALHEMIG